MTRDRRSAGAQPAAYGAFRVTDDERVRPAGSTCLAIDPSTNETVAVYALDVRTRGRRKDAALATALRSWCATPPLATTPAPRGGSSVSPAVIPRPLGAGVESGTPYVVYPLLHGITLDELMTRDGALSLNTVVELLAPVADAIDRAAAAGVHHGALSPAHIIVDDGRVSVTAFGLRQALTQAGLTVPLEPPYASPDRHAGEPPSLADDIYALTAIALAMLAGETPALQPHRSGHEGERMAPPLTPIEEELLKTSVGVDAHVLRQVVDRGLSENPAERPSSATSLVHGLRRALMQEHDASADDGANVFVHSAAATGDVPGRRNVVLAVVVLVALGTVAGLLLAQRLGDPAASPAASDAPAAPLEPVIQPPPPATQVEPPDTNLSKPPAEPVQPALPAPPPDEASRGTRTPSPPAPRTGATRPSAPAVDPNAPGSLMATSNPTGARLFVDGNLVGTTPLLLSGVSPGKHQVRLELDGFQPWSSIVEIEPTRRLQVKVELNQQ